MDFTSSINGPAALALLILGFGFIIFVHELGHFLVAKAVGIKVTQFAIGFGHALLAWRKGIGVRVGTTERQFQARLRQHLAAQGHELDPESPLPEDLASKATAELNLGETEYRLNWMPLGGYVKMVGQEDMDPTAVSSDPRAYNNKPIWARVCVVSAGVVMNAIFAVLFFMVAFLWGVEFPPAEIGDVAPGSPAARAQAVGHPEIRGLAPGDRVLRIDGKPPTDFTSIRVASALAGPDDTVSLVVDRPSLEGEGQQLQFDIAPEPSEELEGLQFLGVAPPPTLQIVGVTGDDTPMAAMIGEMGLRPRMIATTVDGRKIQEFWQLDRLVQKAAGRPLAVEFVDNEGSVQYALEAQTALHTATVPLAGAQRQQVAHLMGLVPAVQVGSVLPDGAAEGLLQPGDLIAAVNDREWPTLQEVPALISQSEGAVTFTVIRDRKRQQVTVEPRREFGQPPMVGIAMRPALDESVVARVLPDSSFAAMNWPAGTVIQNIGNTPVASFGDIRRAVEQSGAGQVPVTAMLPLAGGHTEAGTLQLRAEAVREVASLRWEASNMPPLEMKRVEQKAATPWAAVEIGIDKTQLFMVQTYQTLARLFQGTVGVQNLRGPLGIAVEGTAITQRGLSYLMFFLGLISINLAVINFLPLPIVDGGLFVLLMVEKIRGKPVPPQIQSAITVAGLILLGTIFLTVTYHDIFRMITGG